MAQKLSLEIEKEAKEAFLFFADKDGQIPSKKLEIVLKSLGKTLPEAKLLSITTKIEEKRGGLINEAEFLNIVQHIPSNHISEVEMKRAFAVYDQDKNGLIEIAELRNIFIGNGEKITDQEIDELILEADVDNDKKINYEEFVFMMSNSY